MYVLNLLYSVHRSGLCVSCAATILQAHGGLSQGSHRKPIMFTGPFMPNEALGLIRPVPCPPLKSLIKAI